MKILVIGSGGREHALVWKLAQSNLCEKVFVAPGNAGTADEPKTENVDLSAEDLNGLLDFAIEIAIIGRNPDTFVTAGKGNGRLR